MIAVVIDFKCTEEYTPLNVFMLISFSKIHCSFDDSDIDPDWSDTRSAKYSSSDTDFG